MQHQSKNHSTSAGPLVIALAASLATGGIAIAGDGHESHELLGYNDLLERLGGNVPTGAGVIVAQVEAPDSMGDYAPNPNGPQFISKIFYEMSGPSSVSSHANQVGARQYGDVWSVAPDIPEIYLWEAVDWLGSGFLNAPQSQTIPPEPLPPDIKCLNHSWVGNAGSIANDNNTLRRADLVVMRDDVLMTNGVNNEGGPNLPLLSHMYNGVAVGIRDGTHQAGATGGAYDGPGRMKPEIVAPDVFTSYATPMANATIALLAETARTDPGLSANPNAERSEVLKAVILASAVHENIVNGAWSNNPVSSGPMRGFTESPIDPIVGTGSLNVNRAHLLITGLEQDGDIGVPPATTIDWRGWDLADVVAGDSRYYRYHLPAFADEISVLTTWHRRARISTHTNTIADFDLVMWRVGNDGELLDLVGDTFNYLGGNVASESQVDNIEHLYITGVEAGEYVIELRRVDSIRGGDPDWDVAVAWMFPESTPIPADVNGDGFVTFEDLILVLAAWGPCPGCPEDVDGDDLVGFSDLVAILAAWSS